MSASTETVRFSLQWFASMRVTVTPPVSGIVHGVSSGKPRCCEFRKRALQLTTQFGSTPSLCTTRFAVVFEQYIGPCFHDLERLV
jgi:hypothetical protein